MNRRTILKASAWSLPAIALTIAAPLAAASTPPTPSTARIIWNNKGLSDSGKELDLGIQFPQIHWEYKGSLVRIFLEVKLPRASYSGGFTIADGTNWKPSDVIRSTDFWTLPFTFTKILTQSQSTGNLRIFLDTLKPGPGVQLTAYGVDSEGSTTEILSAVLA